MKAYEVLLESALQCLLNILYNIVTIAVLREEHGKISYLCYLSLSFSLVSLLTGILNATSRCSEKQKSVKLKPAARLLVTLLLTSLPFSVGTTVMYYSHTEFVLSTNLLYQVVTVASTVIREGFNRKF